MNIQIIIVTGAIIQDGNKFLIGRRGPDEKSPGMWEFPGGKVLLSIFRVIVVIWGIYYVNELTKKNMPNGVLVSLGLVIGGAIGNIIDGVFLTRDLTNEPSNILTTTEFAKTITQLTKYGLKVRALEENDLKSQFQLDHSGNVRLNS